MLKYIAIIYLSLHHAEPTPQDHDWDSLIFTQSWPVSVCQTWKEHNPSHTCTMPSNKNSWTIHGIWPTKTASMGPAFCNKTWLFDPEEIKPIENGLIEYWTNVEAGTSTYSLWSHEWTQHGTCAASLDTIRGERRYFGQGLIWTQEYDLFAILNKADVFPSDVKEYRFEEFHRAILANFKVEPCVECRQGNGKQYIQEMRICFNKNLTLTDCKCGGSYFQKYAGLTWLSNCDPSKDIIYPITATLPNKNLIQWYKLVSWLQWFTL